MCAAQGGEFVTARRRTGTLASIPYRVISDALNNQHTRFGRRIRQKKSHA
jgi:hypothetical protein